MKFTKQNIFLVFSLLISGFSLFHLLFGKLIAFSPIIIGFEKHQSEYIDVYYEEKMTMTFVSKVLEVPELSYKLLEEKKEF